MVPELNGSPSVLTKNNSEPLKNFIVQGNKSLKIKRSIATVTTFATMKFFTVMVL